MDRGDAGPESFCVGVPKKRRSLPIRSPLWPSPGLGAGDPQHAPSGREGPGVSSHGIRSADPFLVHGHELDGPGPSPALPVQLRHGSELSAGHRRIDYLPAQQQFDHFPAAVRVRVCPLCRQLLLASDGFLRRLVCGIRSGHRAACLQRSRSGLHHVDHQQGISFQWRWWDPSLAEQCQPVGDPAEQGELLGLPCLCIDPSQSLLHCRSHLRQVSGRVYRRRGGPQLALCDFLLPARSQEQQQCLADSDETVSEQLFRTGAVYVCGYHHGSLSVFLCGPVSQVPGGVCVQRWLCRLLLLCDDDGAAAEKADPHCAAIGSAKHDSISILRCDNYRVGDIPVCSDDPPR